MERTDIRWKQRFTNFQDALAQLTAFIDKKDLNDLEVQGLIQAFEYTHELAWNTLKDFLLEQGQQNLFGSKDVSRKAFQLGLIEHGEIWMEMITSRNQTSHTYNKETATKIVEAIRSQYFNEFVILERTLRQVDDEHARS